MDKKPIPINQIPTEQLTHIMVLKGAEQAELERQWVIIENQRLVVLEEVASWHKGGVAESERIARTSTEYQEFLTRMGEVKKDLTIARNKVKALELEIRTRLNKSYVERAEYKAGGMVP